ncbi:hypothetical protein PX699_08355 [Sphingobium sp. H39-3-25]|uniref:hypothetical protein n=1 Tax=Sphingobium arseniciresistens TaxID=3030834 RepID=UPI0023B9E244|nr:hypothetical protein [Sphingobium arseniciresistens]
MRRKLICLASLVAVAMPSMAGAQATTRQCSPTEEVGPACLLGKKELPSPLADSVFWHIDSFASKADAERFSAKTSTIVEAFGSTWLFTLAPKKWRSSGGKHIANIGPLPVQPARAYTAEYLRSVFAPGMAAPLHVHSGPEAFFAVSGDTCLETPDGLQLARGPSNSLLIRGGPPMLLMAIGKVNRQGFALILHDASQPATTLIHDWHPSGLCERQFAAEKTQ